MESGDDFTLFSKNEGDVVNTTTTTTAVHYCEKM